MMHDKTFARWMIAACLFCGCAGTPQPQAALWQEQTTLSQNERALRQTIIDLAAAGDLSEAERQMTPSLRANDDEMACFYAELSALRGDVPSAIRRYLAFVAQKPNAPMTAFALSRVEALDAQTIVPLDWTQLKDIDVSDDYAKARLVVLQTRAARVGQSRTENLLPRALPLSGWRWFGPFDPFVNTGFVQSQPFDNDDILPEVYDINGQRQEAFRYEKENQTIMMAPKDGIYVSETQIDVAEDGEQLLIARSSVFYELSIDRHVILTRTPNDLDADKLLASRVYLKKGTHTLRLKLAHRAATNGAPIAVWLTPLAPEAKVSERDTISYEPFEPNGVSDIRRIDTQHLLGKDLESPHDDTLRDWFHAAVCLDDGLPLCADAVLKARLQKNPNDRIAQYFMAQRWRSDTAVDRSLRNEQAMQIFRDLSEQAPQMAAAAMQLIAGTVAQNQSQEAFNLWKSYRHQLPENADAYKLQADLGRALDWHEFSDDYLNKAAQEHPNVCSLAAQVITRDFASHAYKSFDSLPDEIRTCPSVIRAYAKQMGDSDPNDSRRWVNAMEALSQRYPNDISLKLEAITHAAENDPAAAAKQFSELIDRAQNDIIPNFDTVRALNLIDAVRAYGEAARAEKLIEKLVQLDPTNEAYRVLDWHMKDEQPLHELRRDGKAIIRDYLKQQSNGAHQEDGNALVILDYAATKMYPNGAKLGLTHIISRVLSKEGKNEIGEVYLPSGASVLKIQTIKSDSLQTFQPENIDFKRSVTAPNLSVGDFVEVEYLTYEPPHSNVKGRVVTDPFFYASAQNPILRSEFVFEYPKNWNVDIVVSGPPDTVTQSCTDQGDVTRCVAYRENIPFFVSEPNAPSDYDIIPNIQVSHDWGWDAIKRTLSETISRQTRQTSYIRRFYEQIPQTQSDSVREKARTIYDYVLTNVEESQETHASDAESATRTVTRGVGSRLLLIKSLYDMAGIPNYFALVRSVAAPMDSEKHPVLYDDAYATYLIADTENGPAYIDPSENFIPFDYLPAYLQGQQVIPIPQDRDTFVSRRDVAEQMRPEIRIEYDIHADGTASAQSVEVMRGARGVNMRAFLTSLKGDDMRTRLVIQNSLARNYGRVELTKLDHKNLDDNNQNLTLFYDFDIADFGRVEDGHIEINSGIYAYKLVDQFAKLPADKRKYPLIIINDTISERNLTFRAPQGYSWDEATLQNIEIHSSFGSFTRQISFHGETLQMKETVSVLPQRVEVSDYQAFRDFCLRVDEAQRTQLRAAFR